MFVAITRSVPPSITRCELTHVARQSIDYDRVRAQHAAYERALETLGCRIQRLPDTPDLPDSVFVEDAAVVFDEIAVLTRPGAASRRPEIESVAAALEPQRTLAFIEEPGTLDGGDVLTVGKTVYVGLSRRTNADGARQLEHAVAPFGHRVVRAAVDGCLHLKSAVTAVSDGAVLLNPAWIDPRVFAAHDRIDVDPSEAAAANVLRVGDRVLVAAAFPRTNDRVAQRGAQIAIVDVSEIAKAEGALTCCSILVRTLGS